MPEFLTTEDFMTPIENLGNTLEFIQSFYNENRFEDMEKAELLIISYKQAMDLLQQSVVEEVE
ncbi:hypothetical protein MKL26_04500 [Streptococcus suis]|nr:hypothetical protein [Streptococcus suis]